MACLVWMAPGRLQGGILHLGLTGMNRSLQERTFKDIEVWKSITKLGELDEAPCTITEALSIGMGF